MGGYMRLSKAESPTLPNMQSQRLAMALYIGEGHTIINILFMF